MSGIASILLGMLLAAAPCRSAAARESLEAAGPTVALNSLVSIASATASLPNDIPILSLTETGSSGIPLVINGSSSSQSASAMILYSVPGYSNWQLGTEQGRMEATLFNGYDALLMDQDNDIYFDYKTPVGSTPFSVRISTGERMFEVGNGTMTVTSSGDVGIGTSTPGFTLDVLGSANSSTDTVAGLINYGLKSAAQLQSLACSSYPERRCMAYDTDADDIVASTGPSIGQWKNERTGAGP